MVIQVYILMKLDFKFKSPLGLCREFTQGKMWAGTLCSLSGEPRALQGPASWGWSSIQQQDRGVGSRRISGRTREEREGRKPLDEGDEGSGSLLWLRLAP